MKEKIIRYNNNRGQCSSCQNRTVGDKKRGIWCTACTKKIQLNVAKTFISFYVLVLNYLFLHNW
jgi:ribosomal protein L37AE/L43A